MTHDNRLAAQAQDRAWRDIRRASGERATPTFMVVLPEEPFMFDPYWVRSVQKVGDLIPVSATRDGSQTQVTFKDGGVAFLKADFDTVVAALAEVFKRDRDG